MKSVRQMVVCCFNQQSRWIRQSTRVSFHILSDSSLTGHLNKFALWTAILTAFRNVITRGKIQNHEVAFIFTDKRRT